MAILQLNMFDGKVCLSCHRWKVFAEYHKDSSRKDGRFVYCKECNCQRSNEWRYAHPDQDRLRQAQCYQDNRDKRLEYSRAYHKKDTERAAQRNREWRLRNRDKHNEDNRIWRKQNREKMCEMRRSWYHRNRIRAIGLVHKRRARLLANGGTFTDAEWQAMCTQCEYRCLCCGEVRPLTMDHIIPVTKGGRHEAANIQALCQPCNSRKGDRTIDYRYNVATKAASVEMF